MQTHYSTFSISTTLADNGNGPNIMHQRASFDTHNVCTTITLIALLYSHSVCPRIEPFWAHYVRIGNNNKNKGSMLFSRPQSTFNGFLSKTYKSSVRIDG